MMGHVLKARDSDELGHSVWQCNISKKRYLLRATAMKQNASGTLASFRVYVGRVKWGPPTLNPKKEAQHGTINIGNCSSSIRANGHQFR